MQCHLNGVKIWEVSKFLDDSPIENTHAIQLVNPFDTAHPQKIPLNYQGYQFFSYECSSIAAYKNEEVPKIHLTAEE